MQKIKLDLNSLSVESFETGKDAYPRGTVQGQGMSNLQCNSDISCNDTCYFRSCDPSACDRCVGGESYDTCFSNDPCVYTNDGGASCNAQNTCIQTCQGLPGCP